MIKFKIEKIEYLESELAFFKVINRLHWRLIQEENDLSLETFGILSLDLPQEGFIEFDKITDKIMYDWVSKNVKYQKSLEKLKKDFEILVENNQKDLIPEFTEIIIN